jgi:hypothetical protein
MRLLTVGHGRLDLIEELPELFGPMVRIALADYLSDGDGDVKRSKQRFCAMSHIVLAAVPPGPGASGTPSGCGRAPGSTALRAYNQIQSITLPISNRVGTMFQATRHFAPTVTPWDAAEARAAIREIAADALSAFDPEELWPPHPMDDGVQGDTGCLYFGAAGIVWALDYLRRIGAVDHGCDFKPALEAALNRNAPWYASSPYSRHASLLMGDFGIQLVALRVVPDPGLANELYALATANTGLPIVELMWGLPGSMLACVRLDNMTGDPRWKALFPAGADRLFSEMERPRTGRSGRRTYMGVGNAILVPSMGSQAMRCLSSMDGTGSRRSSRR